MASQLAQLKATIGRLELDGLEEIQKHVAQETDKKRRSIFRFLDLPAEMRNRIYYFAAIFYLRKYGFTKSRHHGFLSINKQIRAEFAPIYYSTDVVTAKYLTPSEDFGGLKCTSITTRGQLKAIMDRQKGMYFSRDIGQTWLPLEDDQDMSRGQLKAIMDRQKGKFFHGDIGQTCLPLEDDQDPKPEDEEEAGERDEDLIPSLHINAFLCGVDALGSRGGPEIWEDLDMECDIQLTEDDGCSASFAMTKKAWETLGIEWEPPSRFSQA